MKKRMLILTTLMICFAATVYAAPDNPRVKLETSMGIIVLELDRKAAPATAENVLAYVQSGFYDGTVFHRVIKGFMIQGGGFTPDMQSKPTKKGIRNEADNGLKNTRGTVAMARTQYPHSATSQFFINTVNNTFLDYRGKTAQGWGYCVFGRVVQGMDVVDAIESVPTANSGPHQNVPVTPVIIKRATVMNTDMPGKDAKQPGPPPHK